jgi:hypothetical protein
MAVTPPAAMTALTGITETPLPPPPGIAAAKTINDCLDNGKTTVTVSSGGAKEACKPGCVYEVIEAGGSTQIRAVAYHPNQTEGIVVYNSSAGGAYQKTCTGLGTSGPSIGGTLSNTTVAKTLPTAQTVQDFQTAAQAQGVNPIRGVDFVCQPGDNGPSCAGSLLGNTTGSGASGGTSPVKGLDFVCAPGDTGPSCGGGFNGNTNGSGVPATVRPSNLPVPPIPPVPPPASVPVETVPQQITGSGKDVSIFTGAQPLVSGSWGQLEGPGTVGEVSPTADISKGGSLNPSSAQVVSAPTAAPPQSGATLVPPSFAVAPTVSPPLAPTVSSAPFVPLPGGSWAAQSPTTIVVRPNPLAFPLLNGAWATGK